MANAPALAQGGGRIQWQGGGRRIEWQDGGRIEWQGGGRIEWQDYSFNSITRYTHAHHMPHAERMKWRSVVEDFEDVSGTLCCPPPVPFTAGSAASSSLL